VPRLVEVGAEAEASGVSDEPAVGARLRLEGAVRVFRNRRFAADVEVERASREVGAVDGERGATRARFQLAQAILILARTKRRDDF
jgi:hypothetical protein